MAGEVIKTRKARKYEKKKIKRQLSWRNYSTKLRKCKNMIRKAKVKNEKKIVREAEINNKSFF